jgi:hypothetical protein
LPDNRVCQPVDLRRQLFALLKNGCRCVAGPGVSRLCILAGLFLVGAPWAHTQQAEIAAAPSPVVANAGLAASSWTKWKTAAMKTIPAKPPVESEITVSGMVPYGDDEIFGAAIRCTVYTVELEYDRHSWGHLGKARLDYVAEMLPVVFLSQPAKADFWGNPLSPNQELAHGLGISPFGFRILWRSNKAIKPFLVGNAGAIAFTQKAFSPNSSYANFNFQGDFGFEIRLTDRVELRVDPLVYFHVSNGYLPASNPGMDQVAAKMGISYHLGRQGEGR